jgi:hypothetical protein
MPEVDPIVATDVFTLVHVPDAGAEDNVVLLPVHTVRIPVTGDIGFTVTVVVRWQPVGNV